MSNPITGCEEFADRLVDYLERDADDATRAALEAHAQACADCGPLLADLRKLRIDAANLRPLAPSRDLWAGIAARIETPVVELPARGPVLPAVVARRNMRGVWVGLAAAGLVAITATVTHELTKRTMVVAAPAQVAMQPAMKTPVKTPDIAPAVDSIAPRTAAPVQRAAPALVPERALVSNKKAAEPTAQQTYDDEISRLRIVVNRRRPQLDSSTVAVIEHNLKVIDNAIAQCKQALKKDPASRFLMESLNDAMDNKVQLLRTAAVLPTKV